MNIQTARKVVHGAIGPGTTPEQYYAAKMKLRAAKRARKRSKKAARRMRS